MGKNTKKRKELTVGEKYELIDKHDSGDSFRKLGVMYGIGKSSAERIYKTKETIKHHLTIICDEELDIDYAFIEMAKSMESEELLLSSNDESENDCDNELVNASNALTMISNLKLYALRKEYTSFYENLITAEKSLIWAQ